jgi:(S)-ureidoglycine aminohydrolase
MDSEPDLAARQTGRVRVTRQVSEASNSIKPMNIFGSTRTVVRSRYALIAPDGHVPSSFPGWSNATAFVLVSPAMGAGVTQMLVHFHAGDAAAGFPADDHQHAFLILSGSGRVSWTDGGRDFINGDYFFLPAGTKFEIRAAEETRLCLFRNVFVPEPGFPHPKILFGSSNDVKGAPFLGNPKAILKVLLPEDAHMDFAMNIFTYQPGATLPFVETHIMEHGLLMLEGQGIYRLGDSYYPVMAGDAIWMAPYCPQWFVSMGDTPAAYLYCKNVNRLPGCH